MDDEIYRIKKSTLTSMADAVRTKGGTTAPLSIPDGFNQAVADIPSGGDCPEKKILADIQQGTIVHYTHPYEDMPYYLMARQELLETADFPNAIWLRPYTCYRCVNLISVTAPKVTRMGYECFVDASKIQRLIFPNCESIEFSCFKRCTALTYVEIGGTPRYLEDDLFADSGVVAFVIRSQTLFPLQSTATFNGSNIAAGTGYVYVPRTLVEQYKAAPNWSTYAAQIRAIEDYPDITGG